MEEKVYTTAEVAALLKVNRRKVYEMIQAGQVKAINVSATKNPTYRILANSVDNLLGAK